ncbi:hypothetical protein GF339_09610 [candidate division KSB3 bacterium]|uniref:Uncharacterized protein n=1 Tax=candidate division KSB3 bacterium TaxID=2044937 RepID=A0A9D5JVD8_9BACT|nr:hypothetical protein [candidate division KSB3 bacterium]MBD3324829.1 hypothetical protein [candidate division KSB3 bacterium]
MQIFQTLMRRFLRRMVLGVLTYFLIVSPMNVSESQTYQEITPTDAYYVAQSIEQALVQMYGLSRELFEKPYISQNLRPRNVYQKALAVLKEFQTLHPDAIDPVQLAEARNLDINTATLKEVYQLLSLMQKYLDARVVLENDLREQEPQTPSDVYHMLRQVSWRHYQIAQKQEIPTDWATPARVYEATVMNILPAVQAIAEDAEISYDDYAFPKQPVSGLIPRYIYKLLSQVYRNIAAYAQQQGDYDPIVLRQVTECDEISPADVFDLVQVITAELKAEIGEKTLMPDTAARYARWKEEHENVVPGHVFRLMQYNYILTKKILKK